MKALIWTSLACFLLVSCGKDKSDTSSKDSGNPITAPVDYIGAVGKAKTAAERTIDTVSLNQTVQLFHAEEGRFPKDLNELVTLKYLPALPEPPAGSKIQYDPASGQVKVVRER